MRGASRVPKIQEAKGDNEMSTFDKEPQAAVVLAICHRLRDGAARMTRQQFRNCLKRAIGADADYADNVWISFENNPAAFLAHRNPESQSIELIRVILEITK